MNSDFARERPLTEKNRPSLDFQLIFENLPGLFVVLKPDNEFTVLAVSKAFAERIHADHALALGQSFFANLPSDPEPDQASPTILLHANNGEEAIERALNQRFDIVLMDVQMPSVNGYEATRTLREANYRKPIIALTAHAMRGESDKTRDAGCDAHLTKPIDASLLIKCIEAYALAPVRAHL